MNNRYQYTGKEMALTAICNLIKISNKIQPLNEKLTPDG